MPSSPTSSSRSADKKADYSNAIAIIGMSCRVPGAQNIDQLWELLMEGRDMHREVPSERFDLESHYDPSGNTPNATLTKWGCFDEHVSEFDLSLFRMSPREVRPSQPRDPHFTDSAQALQTNPDHRMMMLTSYEALEMAGYSDPLPDQPRPKCGTFFGQNGDEYRENTAQHIDTNFVTGGNRAFGPGRVSYYFGWEGPSMSIDTACSSSAVAINQACNSLRLGDCDMAVTGGVNLVTSPKKFAGLSRAGFLSTTGECKTFDEAADGYCRADGAGSVVSRLS